MVAMISLTEHQYDGRAVRKDEKFEAEEKFVPILEALKRARRAEQDVPAKPQRSRRARA
jgi:hypothetical protein